MADVTTRLVNLDGELFEAGTAIRFNDTPTHALAREQLLACGAITEDKARLETVEPSPQAGAKPAKAAKAAAKEQPLERGAGVPGGGFRPDRPRLQQLNDDRERPDAPVRTRRLLR